MTLLSNVRRVDEKILVSTSFDPDTLLSSIMAYRPEGATGAYAFKWEYLQKSFLSKLARPGVPPRQRREAAVAKMLQRNDICRGINDSGFRCTSHLPLDRILFSASRKIAYVLGPLTSGYRIPAMFEQAGFSNGATVDCTRETGDPYFKYRRRTLSVTPAAYNYALSVIRATPVWSEHEHPNVKRVMGNHVFTVPKSTEIDRAACKEPTCNNMLQKAIGKFIRSRLLSRAQINLNDQTINQQLAELGSLTGSLATIDLSGASDSMSQRLVFDLLPLEWVKLLDSVRSPRGLLPDGSTVVWEMHSTMGNGYTFELESLIFWAICSACRDFVEETICLPPTRLHRRNISVYGDDIICPTAVAPYVIEALRCVGFDSNEDKTFISGPFRESCGKHYYEGVDVSPIYMRKPIDTVPRVIWLLNSLRIWSWDCTLRVCDPSLEPFWRQIRRKYVPSELLGGRYVRSITSVHSPEEPRESVMLVYDKQIHLTGYPRLLRWFQFAQSESVSTTKWYEQKLRDDEVGVHGMVAVSKNTDTIPDVSSPLIYRVFREIGDSSDEYFFPSELVNHLSRNTPNGV